MFFDLIRPLPLAISTRLALLRVYVDFRKEIITVRLKQMQPSRKIQTILKSGEEEV